MRCIIYELKLTTGKIINTQEGGGGEFSEVPLPGGARWETKFQFRKIDPKIS